MDSGGPSGKERKELYTRVMLRLAIIVLVVLACVLAARRLVSMALPFFFAVLLAWALNPLIKRLSGRFRLPRKPITVVLLILVFVAITGLFFWCLYTLVYEVVTLAMNWEIHWGSFVSTISNIEKKIVSSEVDPSGAEVFLWETVDTILSWLQDSLGETVGLVVGVSGSMASGIVAASVALVAFIMSSYFITVDYPRLSWKINDKLGESMRSHLQGIKDNFLIIAGGYVKHQFFLSASAFVVLTAGFLLVRQQYALLLALVLSIVDFIPFFGPGVVLIPWTAICFMSDRLGKGISLLIIYIVVTLARLLLKSVLPKTKPGLTPVQLLVSIYAGYIMGGIPGMVWCPILLVLFLNFCKTGVFKNTVRDIKAVMEDIRRQTGRDNDGV
ncbi:MAG: AI-2E family transporter [Oscillospiraceae bacterium]|nr:AI-2E family transporter [Oscillospiraceae bacterium]